MKHHSKRADEYHEIHEMWACNGVPQKRRFCLKDADLFGCAHIVLPLPPPHTAVAVAE